MTKGILCGLVAFAALVGGGTEVRAADKLKIVATTSTFASLVTEIAGDKAEVRYVSLPKFNTHYFTPKFSDVRHVQKADLFVQAGLDHEIWTNALLEAAGRPELFKGGAQNLALSDGIHLLDVPDHDHELSREHGDVHIFGNPHIWMNPENSRIMAKHIVKRLKVMDATHASYYEARANDFIARLDKKILEWKIALAPIRGKQVVSYHKDIAYFAEFAGFEAHEFYEPKPGIPPTPKSLLKLEKHIKENGIRAIIQPVYYSRQATDALAAKTGANVYIICQNAGELPGTEDFISLFDYNVKTISEALK